MKSPSRFLSLLLLVCAFAPVLVSGLGRERLVDFDSGRAFLLADGRVAPLCVDEGDWPGVKRAAGDLQADLERVGGVRPEVLSVIPGQKPLVVLVGTLGRSALVDGLVRSGKLDASRIAGRWEAFRIELVENPLPNVERALVIAGSDKRGTIYGIYELSEQIGVSPWYWWADVPVERRSRIGLTGAGLTDEGPRVKYRGIFLNDEAPALSGWAKEKFGGVNSRMYAHVFELILRLRGNYLWPAMWSNAFNEDDPASPALADEYGVVMGTSHHEPMIRSQQEWARHGNGIWDYQRNEEVLKKFWADGIRRNKDFESIVTIGMRGDGDEPMSEEANVSLLERIVADQRAILARETGRPAEKTPQLWALYKEVQEYYEHGMRVPDDVTLLWCDDNWGNLRRLPSEAERKRSGGAGIYYHFDYVGGPRCYKWLNTIPLTKIWEQMNLAVSHGADRIWIVNVGDLKPMEFPIEYFLSLAWAPERWPYEKIEEFSQGWAAREFGAAQASEIATLVNGYTKLNGRRKPEMIAPDTLSLVSYREAERVLGEWASLVSRAEKAAAALPAEAQSAFYQLVLYPIQASANLQQLYVSAGLNHLYARQGRIDANDEEARVRRLFERDAELAARYHGLNGGKWNHMMDQAKFGYTSWQEPPAEVMPAVSILRPNRGAVPGLAVEGREFGYYVWGAPPPAVPELNALSNGTAWLELYNRGDQAYTFEIENPASGILTLSAERGSVLKTVRVEIGVSSWAAVPAGKSAHKLRIVTSQGHGFVVTVPLFKPEQPQKGSFAGHVETDGVLAIEAPHYSRTVDASGLRWTPLPGFGRTLGGVTPLPAATQPLEKAGGSSPRIEYDVYLYGEGSRRLTLDLAPSLDFLPGEPLRFGVSLDDQPPVVVKVGTWETLPSWEKAVGDGVRRVQLTLPVDKPGAHTLKLWYLTPGVVFERLTLEAAGKVFPRMRPTYLGPPESPRFER